MRRVWLLVVAALALIAPSCPGPSLPSDYDPDNEATFSAYPATSDLVYLSASAGRGDLVYVLAAENGQVIGRIDGPDRRSWVVDASRKVGFYAVSRAGGPTTLHRIDLRSGARRIIAKDDRASLQTVPDEDGRAFMPLAITGDGSAVIAVRVLKDHRLWIGRYDSGTGALAAEASWPLREDAAAPRLAVIAVDRFAVGAFEQRGASIVRQQLHVLDAGLNELSSLGAESLPDATPCSMHFVQTPEGWGTVCAWRNDRYPTILVLDPAFRVLRSRTITLRSAESILAFGPAVGGIGLVTDRGRATPNAAIVELSDLSDEAGRPVGLAVVRPIHSADGSLVLTSVIRSGDVSSSAAATLALIDLTNARIVAERPLQNGLLDVKLDRAVYALVAARSLSEPATVMRFDRTLSPTLARTFATPEGIALAGIALVVRTNGA
ncbi:MAG: hypothetical protein M3R54_04345 [Chloroflexota bacterium]|nr:hypothetical protein [Chloroflexota bacterium]